MKTIMKIIKSLFNIPTTEKNISRRTALSLSLIYIFIPLLILIPIMLYANLDYDRIELDASAYYTYFYDLNGDNKKDIIEIIDEIKIYYHLQDKYSDSPLTIQCPVKNLIFDFANLEKETGSDLIFLKEDGVYRFKKKNNVLTDEIEKLIDSSSFFIERDNTSQQFADISYDLNNDGIDEIFIPRLDSVLLFKKVGNEFKNTTCPPISMSFEQEFNAANMKSMSSDKNKNDYSFSYTSPYTSPSFLLYDFNNDGLKDIGLVYNTKGEGTSSSTKNLSLKDNESDYDKDSSTINIYLQKNDLTFSNNYNYQYHTPIPFYIYKRYYQNNYLNLIDINNDHFPDLILENTYYNIFSPKTSYKIFIGDQKKGFKKDFDQILLTKDLSRQAFFTDINADGLTDITLMYMDINFSSVDDMAKIILGRNIEVVIRIHLGQEKRLFNKEPNFSKKIKISSKCFFWRYIPNFQTSYDFNGDGKLDLAIRRDPDKLYVYNFINEKKGFSKKPITVFNISKKTSIKYDDLNNDKRMDIIESGTGNKLVIHLSK